MATFRSSVLVLAVLCLACTPRESNDGPPEVAAITSVVLRQVGARGNAIEWPKEITLEPGTYFWRVVGIKGDRTIADSGRSAFVVSR